MKTMFGQQPNGNIVGLGRRFLHWWMQELLALIPEKWRPKPQSRLEVRPDDNGFALSAVHLDKVVANGRLDQGRLDPPDFLAGSAVKKSQARVWLFPPTGAILSRLVQVPASAVSTLESLLELEMDRWSPYRLNEVYIGWDERESDSAARRNIHLSFVPRILIDQLRADLATADIGPAFLVLAATKRHFIDLRTRSERQLGAGTMLSLASVVLLLTAIVVDWFAVKSELNVWRSRYKTELSLLSSQRNLEEKISRAVISVEQTSSVVSKGRLLAALSAALPETDWLSEVTIKNNSLTLRGYAGNLDRLVKTLEPIAADQNINIEGEVAFDATTGRQRFAVTFRPSGT